MECELLVTVRTLSNIGITAGVVNLMDLYCHVINCFEMEIYLRTATTVLSKCGVAENEVMFPSSLYFIMFAIKYYTGKNQEQ